MTPIDPATTADMSTYVGEWRLVTGETAVTFRTRAMWVMPVKGTVEVLDGHGRVGEDGAVEARVVMDAASIRTGIKKRDEHLRSAEFFDTATHPTFEYVLTSVRPVGPGRVALEGTLTIAGRSRPLRMEADVTVEGPTAKVHGEIAHLDRSDWSVDFTKMGAQLDTKVVVDATWQRS